MSSGLTWFLFKECFIFCLTDNTRGDADHSPVCTKSLVWECRSRSKPTFSWSTKRVSTFYFCHHRSYCRKLKYFWFVYYSFDGAVFQVDDDIKEQAKKWWVSIHFSNRQFVHGYLRCKYIFFIFLFLFFCAPVLVCLLLSLFCAVSFVLFCFCLAGAQLVATVNDT